MISIKQEDFNDNYELFVKLCEITSEPLKLVKEGASDLIVMNAEAFDRRRKMLDLREKLLRYNDDEPLGTKGISLEELGKYINELESDKSK
ncbi:MAG: prevent-host-death protein [Ruminococcus sp.]|nr:prevent-host-death protein [Ruminococcus sp.]